MLSWHFFRFRLVVLLSTLTAADAALAQGPMTNGATHAGAISVAEVDTWTFTANAGEYVAINVGEVGADTGFSPHARLLRPDSVVVQESSGGLAATLATVVQLTGTYSVRISDNNNIDPGNYRLTLAKAGAFSVSSGDEGGPMANGANHAGSIYPGDLDMWSVSLDAGEVMRVTLAKVGGTNVPFVPWIKVIGPDGSLFQTSVNTLAVMAYGTVSLAGTYTVLVSSADSGNDDAGTYIVRTAKATDPFVVPSGDDGGAMVPAIDYAATIDRGDLDLWTFSATAGNHIALEISETIFDRAFQPWITLYSPTGQFLDNRSGSVSATIHLSAPESGTYRVVVTDLDVNAGGGTYRMRVGGVIAAVPNPLGDLAVDFGPGYGLWLLANRTGPAPQWTPLHGLSPTALASGDIDGNGQDDLIMTFAGYGVWIWLNNATWRQLHPIDATEIVTGDLDGNGQDDIILSFAGYGLWIYTNDASWSQLQGLASAGMATGNLDGDAGGKSDLLVNFAGHGLYAYVNNAAWTQIHPLNAKHMAIGDIDGNGVADLALSFSGYGVWIRWASGGWTLLDPDESTGLTFANADGDAFQKSLILSGPDGTWAWKYGAQGMWSRLHPLQASRIVASDFDRNGSVDLIMSFPGYGIWLWRQGVGYIQVHPFNPEALVTGLIDNQ